jgi:hypothetical protein
MIAGVVSDHRDEASRGYHHGVAFRPEIQENVRRFRSVAERAGLGPDDLRRLVGTRDVPPSRLAEMAAIADGAHLNIDDVVAFDLFNAQFSPDECTVAMGVGSASATGGTMFMKNSDKIGADSLTGEGFHNFKEINVVLDLRTESGRRIIGVAAAGSTGLKMDINDAGVAGGTNISRTLQLKNERTDIAQLRALDRGQLLRDGLEMATAREAAVGVLNAVIQNPTGTPGNIEFAQHDVAYVVEGSYNAWAIEEVRDAVLIRSNTFELLSDLNDPDDVSSQLRSRRSHELLDPLVGDIELTHLRALSQDHANGPGLNSLCRHSADHNDETSLSAMVATLDPNDPLRSKVEIALGKPCWAWNDPAGVLSFTLGDAPAIPGVFRTGSVWRSFYREEPKVS